MTPHGVGVVERREVDSAAAVPACSGCEGASDVSGQLATLEEGGEVCRGERVWAGNHDNVVPQAFGDESCVLENAKDAGSNPVHSDPMRSCIKGGGASI